jgi:hypothetical protein
VITDCIGNRHLMWRHKVSAALNLAGAATAVPAFNRMRSAPRSPSVASPEELLRASLKWPPEKKDELADAFWQACSLPPVDDFLSEHRPYFDWDGLEAWLATGSSVGLHTRTHPDCSQLSAEGLEDEIGNGARELRDRLGLTKVPFSFPFGRRAPDAAIERFVAEGTISCALGIRGSSPRGTPAHRLERAELEEGSGFELYGRALLS